MRALLTMLIVIVIALIGAIALHLIDIDQIRGAKLPTVAVTGGQAPAYDVKTASVELGSKKTEVNVPKVDVGTTRKEVDVPTVAVKKPGE